jgi:S1-C subfamily serine protease
MEGGTGVVAPGSTSTTVYGAAFAPIASGDKEQLGIENGVKITSVSEGRFRDLGLSKGAVIITVNGQKVNSAADVRKATNNEKSLSSIEGYTTDGTYFKYQTRR